MYYCIEALRIIGDLTIKGARALGYLMGAVILYAWLYVMLVMVLAL